MSIKRVANKDARRCVADKVVFTGSNIFSMRHHMLYVVYSYGHHFPMYVYDYEIENWIYNTDKYSVSTSRHQSQTDPLAPIPIYMNTDRMLELISAGSYVDFCAERINPEHEEIA